MKKSECPYCGFVKVFHGRELKKFRKKNPGFTCLSCGAKVSSGDLARKRNSDPKPRRQRVRKEAAKNLKIETPTPQIEANPIKWKPRGRDVYNRWQNRSTQPTDLSFREAATGSFDVNPSACSPPSGLLPALAIIWTPPPELSVEEVPPAPPEEEEAEEEGEEGGTPLFIRARRYGRVEVLHKDLQRLNLAQTIYLKERYLKGLDGYEEVKGFDRFFVEGSALARGEYGDVYYACRGAPYGWKKTYRVEVLIRDKAEIGEVRFKLKPIERRPRGGRRYGSKYDPLLDQFMEGEYEIAEVTIEGREPSTVRTVLAKRVETRGLKDRLKVGYRGGILYLKKL